MRTHEAPTTGSDGAPVTTTPPSDPARVAVDRVVQVGPSFLDGTIDADRMANTMVDAVRTWKAQREAVGDAVVTDPQLEMVLREIYGCGAGYLRDMCDGACVARTITALVDEFGTPAS